VAGCADEEAANADSLVATPAAPAAPSAVETLPVGNCDTHAKRRKVVSATQEKSKGALKGGAKKVSNAAAKLGDTAMGLLGGRKAAAAADVVKTAIVEQDGEKALGDGGVGRAGAFTRLCLHASQVAACDIILQVERTSTQGLQACSWGWPCHAAPCRCTSCSHVFILSDLISGLQSTDSRTRVSALTNACGGVCR
jgi:hypothetical protein